MVNKVSCGGFQLGNGLVQQSKNVPLSVNPNTLEYVELYTNKISGPNINNMNNVVALDDCFVGFAGTEVYYSVGGGKL